MCTPSGDPVSELVKAPVRLPPGRLRAFGYPGGRRFVALYWEPCGDESCYHDGAFWACGAADNWLLLDLLRRPDLRGWLDDNDFRVGNSEEPATHWLVADGLTGDLYAAPRRAAGAALRSQVVG